MLLGVMRGPALAGAVANSVGSGSGSLLRPRLVAASASGWLAYTSRNDNSPGSVANDLRVTTWWKATSPGGTYAVVRSVTTLTNQPTTYPEPLPSFGRIAQNSTYLLAISFVEYGTYSVGWMMRAPLDLSADPAVITPSPAFTKPRIVVGDGSRFLLVGEFNNVYQSADNGLTWSLLGTMSGATFPNAIGNDTLVSYNLAKIGSRWFLTFMCSGDYTPASNRLFYSDNADAVSGWTQCTGLTIGNAQQPHAEVAYDGTKHYFVINDMAAGTSTIYASTGGGAAWTSEQTFTGQVVKLHITGTTGADYVRAYVGSAFGGYQTYEKLVGTTSWSSKASGLVAPYWFAQYGSAMAAFDDGTSIKGDGSQVRYETAGVFSLATGF